VNEAGPSTPRLLELVERAFDYRGYVTVRRRDGSELVGYLYDRGPSHVDLLDETATRRTRLARDEIADIRFTGDDPVRRSQEIWERRKGSLEPRDTPAYGQWAGSRPVLLAVALEQELRHAARALGIRRQGASARGSFGGSDVVALAVGIGGGGARAISEEEPRLVVSCGFCGALDARLEVGDLVLAASVRGAGESAVEAPPAALLAAARRALSGLRFFEGEVLCTTSVAATPSEKRALGAGGALAVDMETHALALAASKAGIPWLSVRAVLDPLGAALPAFAREPRKGYLAPALRHALASPKGAIQIARLAANARRAGASLEEAVRRLASGLPAEART
jgi:adenosylhomocysteine nucleosidase